MALFLSAAHRRVKARELRQRALVCGKGTLVRTDLQVRGVQLLSPRQTIPQRVAETGEKPVLARSRAKGSIPRPFIAPL